MSRSETTRRQFAALLPALLAATTLSAHAQQAGDMEHPIKGEPTPGPGAGRTRGDRPRLVSGVYTPGANTSNSPQREAHRFLDGLLQAGNIQLEIHETTQQPGAVHEATDKHLHNEIWLVREGVCELTTNGVTRTMRAGDVGLCCAGDLHYIRNAGATPCTYFVVTVGPPRKLGS